MCHNSDSNDLMLFSEVQRNDIYADIKEILQEAEQATRSILEAHREQVKKLATILLQRKTIQGKDLPDLFGK